MAETEGLTVAVAALLGVALQAMAVLRLAELFGALDAVSRQPMSHRIMAASRRI